MVTKNDVTFDLKLRLRGKILQTFRKKPTASNFRVEDTVLSYAALVSTRPCGYITKDYILKQINIKFSTVKYTVNNAFRMYNIDYIAVDFSFLNKRIPSFIWEKGVISLCVFVNVGHTQRRREHRRPVRSYRKIIFIFSTFLPALHTG